MRQKQRVFSLFLLSPSSRRAWIEIASLMQKQPPGLVALLTEGVDRNPPAQRGVQGGAYVALLTEGVDRNYDVGSSNQGVCRRPPHGGRG